MKEYYNNMRIKTGYYVMSSLYIEEADGPFDTQEEAKDHLLIMCGDYASPELLRQFLVFFNEETQDLKMVKDESGRVINGEILRS